MNTATSSVLILGANGRIGSALCQAFATAGWRVLAQTRRPLSGAPAGVLSVDVDVMQTDALCQAAQGVQVIVNALNPPYPEWDRLAFALANQAMLAAQASSALLMFPGNVYNFGNTLPAKLHVNTPQIGNHGKARIRIDIEQQLQSAASLGVRSVVIRAGDFFGNDRRGSWLDLIMLKSIQKGRLIYPGPANIQHAWAYLPDLAQTFVLLAEQHASLQGARTFHFPGYAVTGEEFHRAMEIAYGKPLKLAGAPWGWMQLAAPFSRMMREVLEMRYLWERPHALVDDELQMQLGRALPYTPLPQALTASLYALDIPTACPKVVVR